MNDWTNGVSTLYQADAREIPLPDASVHMCVTSPPYWGLRDYGLGQWEGGDAECGHERPFTDSTTLPNSGFTNNGHKNESWPNNTCGLCGAKNTPAGIGLEPTLGEWVENIVAVMREVRRVLRDDGTVWLNIGDAYSGGGRGTNPNGKQGTNVGTFGLKRESGSGLASKNLMGQPWRVAFALQDDGWILRSAIVWHKPNPMPESVTDRPTSSYEMIFLLTKSGIPQFWTHRDLPGQRTAPTPDYRWRDALTGIEFTDEPDAYTEDMFPCPDCGGEGSITREAGQVSMFGGVPAMVKECAKCKGKGEIKRWKRSNLWQGHDYFYDAEAVREPSKSPGRVVSYDGSQKTTAHENRTYPGATPKDTVVGSHANVRNVWLIPTQGRPDAHFATFPDELPRRCILAGTSEHGVCSECGAPWARVVESEHRPNQSDNNGKHDGTLYRTVSGGVSNDARKRRTLGWQPTCGCNAECKIHKPRNPQGKALTSPRQDGNSWNENEGRGFIPKPKETMGWQPTCSCAATIVPATVLDPFVGSGTTVAVAQALGRRGVGLDLNSEYLKIAANRIGAVPLPLIAKGVLL